MQQFAYTRGKNSTDSALIIDAMDLLYAGNLDGFVIVSSDSDFTRLATRLRESGMTVYGLGAEDAAGVPGRLRQVHVPRGAPRLRCRACGRRRAQAVETEEPGSPRRSPSGHLQSMLTKALNRTASATTTGRPSGAWAAT